MIQIDSEYNDSVNCGLSDNIILEQNDKTIHCKYYDKDNLNSKFKKNNHISFLHLNIRSLTKHFDNFQELLNSLDIRFKIIALSETRLITNSLAPHNLCIDGYSLVSNSTEASAGGTAIYVCNSLNYRNRQDLSSDMYQSKKLESTFIEISRKGRKSVVVGCIYKHPGMPVNEFADAYFAPTSDKVNKERKKGVFLGDFNINLLDFGKKKEVDKFIDTATSHNFFPTISLPTRITDSTSTLIDNIYISPDDISYESGNLLSGISDHLAQFLIPVSKEIHEPRESNSYRDWRSWNKFSFVEQFKNTRWRDILRIDSNDVDYSFEKFFEKLSKMIETHVPLKNLSKKQLKRVSKPWITKDIKRSISNRDNLLKRYLRTKGERRSVLFNQYKLSRNHIVDLIRQSKSNYYRNFFDNNLKSSKIIWSGINSLISSKSKKKKSNVSLDVDGHLTSDKKLIAESFNEYFTQIAEKIKERLPQTKKSFRDFLDNPCGNSFFLSPTTPEEVKNIVISLDTKKATGPYSIPHQLLHELPTEISCILSDIFNQSFKTGKFIKALKNVKVIPVFKNKGSPSETGNYRPISLLSNVDKILEKLVHKRMTKFLNRNNIIYNRQFGFREKHSTVHGLATLTEDIKKSIDEGKLTCGVFIDLQKAFDTVDHEILLKKLETYGFRGLANNWFSSYLSKRKQYVHISGKDSDYREIKHGVPQGSVLGPILFLLYINDLSNAIIYCRIYNFADDTAILYTEEDPRRLKKRVNIDLKLLLHWLKANKIHLNVAKTEVLLFKNKRKQLNFDIKIKLDGKLMRFSKETKYLGMIIDDNLAMDSHKKQVCDRLRKANGALSLVRHYVPYPVLRSIYFALFQPHIQYGLQIWGQNLSRVSRVARLQKIAVRVMTFSEYNTPSKPLFTRMNILSVQDYVFKLNIILAHEILNHISPIAVQQSLNLEYLPVTQITRGTQKKMLKRPYVRTTKHGIYSMRYQSVIHWNRLQKYFEKVDLVTTRQTKINTMFHDYLKKKE